ncbi:MAG: class I SAM-dependent methyltransferase [Burkholderiales bacterium]|nr:class I SAM-dependent methyltransferase [Burkholderiales bacterium]
MLNVRRTLDRALRWLERRRQPRPTAAAEPTPASPSGAMVAEPWDLDHAVIETDGAPPRVRLTGWALPELSPPDDDTATPSEALARYAAQSGRFTVNGRAPLHVDYPQQRPALREHFWQRRDAEYSGFTVIADLAYPDGYMEVRCANSTTEAMARGRESWFLPDPAQHTDLPDADRRYRVIGNRDVNGFLWLGATDAMRLKMACEAYCGAPLFGRNLQVLDWGVGCGRIARHLAPGIGDGFHGCDIDADNVSWCAAHLPGRFAPSKLEPPLPWPDATFDVIYGVSVFTHLRREWEQRWLAELRRVLKPGGVLMVTVHGQTAIDFAGLSPTEHHALQDRLAREGLVVTSSNNQLDGFVDHPDEYVNVFHSPDYIEREWATWFGRIVRLPGYLFTHDLILATKAP